MLTSVFECFYGAPPTIRMEKYYPLLTRTLSAICNLFFYVTNIESVPHLSSSNCGHPSKN